MTSFKQLGVGLLLLLGGLTCAKAQGPTYYNGIYFDAGTAVPGRCTPPAMFYNTSNTSVYACGNDSHFHQTGGGSGPTGSGYGATSLTLNTVASGSHTFTIISNEGSTLAYAVGGYVGFYSSANTANFMEGTITAFDGTVMTANITNTGGSGAHADWNVSVAGKVGPTGLTGNTGANGVINVIEDEGTPLTQRSNLNFTGAGVTCADSGAKTVCTVTSGGSGTGVTKCAPASSSGTAYTCTGSPTLSSYAAGTTLLFVPDVAGSGGATTVNVDSLGAKTVKRGDGSTNPDAASFVAGNTYLLVYDGTNFRLPDGYDPSKSGALDLGGLTSGAVALSAADVAGTAITYVLPSTNGAAGQVLTDSGTTTCPTMPSTFPSTCHLLQFVASNGSGNFLRSAGTAAIASGKTITVSNTLTETATDGSTVAFGGGGTVAYTVASGTATMGTSLIASGACASVVTVVASGAATTDVIVYTPNTDPTAVTGYGPSASGSLYVWPYPTSGNVNFKVCNNTSASITPSALTFNWRVAR